MHRSVYRMASRALLGWQALVRFICSPTTCIKKTVSKAVQQAGLQKC